MTESEKILITGAGAVCGAGLTVDAIWDAVVNGRSAIAPITQWNASQWPASVAAEVRGVDNRTLVEDRKIHKILSRSDLFGLYAARTAIERSGLFGYRDGLDDGAKARFNDRSGVFAGSGGATYRCNYDFFPLLTAVHGDLQAFGRDLGASVSPMWLLKNLPNNVVCHVGIRHNFKGTNGCITNQCAGGSLAVAESAAAIRAGEADRMVAVGHDSPIEPETVFHYYQLGLMAGDTIRPFDRERSGTVFGEGAAAVVLETETSARARHATVLGEFLGSGCVTEASGVLDVRADGEGVSRAIELALADAGVPPEAVGMIVAHGNGTQASDASEAIGIGRVFGKKVPPVTAFKWAFGHLIAASGILDLVLGLKAIQEKTVPGIPTLESVDADLSFLPVGAEAQKPRSDIMLGLCRGFAGMNVALVIRAG